MEVDVFLNNENNRQSVGRLSDRTGKIQFQYDRSFLKQGIEISPLNLPLRISGWQSKNNLFDGLPGIFADSLPDGWGNLLLDRQLRRLGKRLADTSPLERLCGIGKDGMGALEYEPASDDLLDFHPEQIQLDVVAENAAAVLAETATPQILDSLRSMNGSSGGARPKIVCLVSDDRQKIKRGHLAENGFTPWIIKFRQQYDPIDAGAQEYICLQTARAAGINTPECHLFESALCPGWLGVRRFDRTATGKRHMATVAGLLHCDYRLPSLDYASLMALTKMLAGTDALIEMFKRTVFNFLLNNNDDHAKNFSFIMDAKGQWQLSPIYDVLPDGMEKSEHMTALLGKGKNITRQDFIALASRFDIPEQTATNIIDNVCGALMQYPSHAKTLDVHVPAAIQANIKSYC